MPSRETFRPALWKVGATNPLYLPLPILDFSVPFQWKHDSRRAPYRETLEVYGCSRDPQQITISGEFGVQNGESLNTEAAMWDAVEEINAFMDCSPAETLELFVYIKPSIPTEYRKFKGCIPVSFQTQVGDSNFNAWTYQIGLLLKDTTIYTTAPGV